MATTPITWLVLAREVPPTITVRDMDRLAAALVLDVDTGVVRGVAIEATAGRALRQALTAALTRSAGGLPAGPPHRVLHAPGLAEPVRTALADTAVTGAPRISEVQPGPEAEDIFDSFLGHLAGRAQLEAFPGPDDWRLLIGQAAAFHRTQPWIRWSDEHDLHIHVDHADESRQYAAVVMGQAGVQRGLVLYPGEQPPAWLRGTPPARRRPAPSGRDAAVHPRPG